MEIYQEEFTISEKTLIPFFAKRRGIYHVDSIGEAAKKSSSTSGPTTKALIPHPSSLVVILFFGNFFLSFQKSSFSGLYPLLPLIGYIKPGLRIRSDPGVFRGFHPNPVLSNGRIRHPALIYSEDISIRLTFLSREKCIG